MRVKEKGHRLSENSRGDRIVDMQGSGFILSTAEQTNKLGCDCKDVLSVVLVFSHSEGLRKCFQQETEPFDFIHSFIH